MVIFDIRQVLFADRPAEPIMRVIAAPTGRRTRSAGAPITAPRHPTAGDDDA
jgi:hypothetical protein